MNKHLILSLVFLVLVFQGNTQWYWQYPIPQGNPINDLHMMNNKGFAVGTHGSILETNDRGNNWSLMDSVTVNELTSVYIGKAEYAHAVGDFGTILQMTNGEDWNTMISGTHYKLNGVASTPSAAKTFSVGYKGLILKTEMDWVEWKKINSPTLDILYAVDFATEQIGIIVGDSGTILRTTDAGESWSFVSSGLNQPLFDVHFPSESIGYLVGGQGTILRTTDAGASWNDVSFNAVENKLTAVYFGDDTAGCAVGSYGLVITTRDGGNTWDYYLTGNDLPLFAAHYYRMPSDTVCDSITVGGANGQILKRDSCGYSWKNTTYSSTYILNDIQFPENNVGFAVGGDPYNDLPYLLKYVDSTSWSVLQVDTITHYLTEIFFLNQNVGYISGRYGSIYKTSDQGISWAPLESGVNETLYSIYFLNNLIGLAAGTNGTIIKTTSGDTIWSELNSGTTYNLYSLYLTQSTNGGYAVGDEGTILKINSGGNEIYPIESGTTEPLFDVFIVSDTVAFIVGFNGTILKIQSVTGINVVLPVASGVTTPLNRVFFTTESIGYIAGDRGVMLKTTNRGATWYPQYIATSNNLQALTFNNQETGYTAGSGVSILKTTNGGGGVILPFISENRTKDFNIDIYPNPVSSQSWIAYNLSDKSKVQISLFDLSGQEIKKILENKQQQGKQKIQLDASSMQPGIYLVVIQVNDQLFSEKMIIY